MRRKSLFVLGHRRDIQTTTNQLRRSNEKVTLLSAQYGYRYYNVFSSNIEVCTNKMRQLSQQYVRQFSIRAQSFPPKKLVSSNRNMSNLFKHQRRYTVVDPERANNTLIIASRNGNSLPLSRIESMINHILNVTPGDLKDTNVREACRALSLLNRASSQSFESTNISRQTTYQSKTLREEDILNEWIDSSHNAFSEACTIKERIGKLSFDILERLLVEEKQQCLIGFAKRTFVDSTVYHEAIKCMLRSENVELIKKADSILENLENIYLEYKSTIYPESRCYALLLYSLKYDKSNVVSGDEGDDFHIVNQVKGILDRIQRQERHGNPHAKMNAYICNCALNTLATYANNKNSEALKFLEEILLKPMVPLDQISFSIAIKALLAPYNSKMKGQPLTIPTVTLTKKAEILLLQMQDLGLGHPNEKLMTPLLTTLAEEGNISEILHFLEWMESLYQNHGWLDTRPNRIHFNTMLHALSKTQTSMGIEDGGHKALLILQKMKEHYNDGDNDLIQPDIISYNAVLNAFAKEKTNFSKRRNNSCERADTLLVSMENGLESKDIVPNLISYNAVLLAYSNNEIPDVERMNSILNRMIEKEVEPNLLTYTIFIKTFSRIKKVGHAQKAEDLLRALEWKYENGQVNLKPDLVCYNSVIQAWANSHEKGSVTRAKQILKEMEDSGNSDLTPDAVSYTTIFTAMANNPRKFSVEYVLKMLDNMISACMNGAMEPEVLNTAVFNATIKFLIKSGDDLAEKCDELLLRMEHLSRVDSYRFGRVSPNTITFNSVIDAWSKSKCINSAARAEKILHKMSYQHQEGNKSVCPDLFSFSSVLNAHAEKGNAEKAEKILKYMIHLNESGNKSIRPNTICFSTVIKAYSTSRREGSAQRAENLLKWMYASKNADIKPNTVAFTSVATAWSRSHNRDAVVKIKNLIQWMKTLSKQGYKDVEPNQFTFNALLNAISRSDDDYKIEKAEQVLRDMENIYSVQANMFTYNAVLRCASSRGNNEQRRNVLRKAVVLFEKALAQSNLEDSVNVTYGIFFTLCGNLIPKKSEKEEINRMLEAVFKRCCHDGNVDGMIINQFRNAASKSLYERSLKHIKNFPFIKVEDIPCDWRRNLKR